MAGVIRDLQHEPNDRPPVGSGRTARRASPRRPQSSAHGNGTCRAAGSPGTSASRPCTASLRERSTARTRRTRTSCIPRIAGPWATRSVTRSRRRRGTTSSTGSFAQTARSVGSRGGDVSSKTTTGRSRAWPAWRATSPIARKPVKSCSVRAGTSPPRPNGWSGCNRSRRRSRARSRRKTWRTSSWHRPSGPPTPPRRACRSSARTASRSTSSRRPGTTPCRTRAGTTGLPRSITHWERRSARESRAGARHAPSSSSGIPARLPRPGSNGSGRSPPCRCSPQAA